MFLFLRVVFGRKSGEAFDCIREPDRKWRCGRSSVRLREWHALFTASSPSAVVRTIPPLPTTTPMLVLYRTSRLPDGRICESRIERADVRFVRIAI